MTNIPFHKPYYDAEDEKAIVASLRSNKIVGDGEQTKTATEMLKQLLGVKHVLLTTSCTHALELAMMALDLKPWDEVIVPSFTFVSTTNCVLRQGAKVVFVDIKPDTLTIDVDDVIRKITGKTRAIIPVVYAGVSPDLDELLGIARKDNIIVVEDAAQAIGAGYKGKPQGTIGDMGAFSFHETKNFSTGEGGAFVTNSDNFALRAEIIREKGTNRKQFVLGLVDKYSWVDVGSSYLPSDLQAALLISQLNKMKFIQKRREEIHNRYMGVFTRLAQDGKLILPTIPVHTTSNYHIFYVLMRDEATRNAALSFFRSKGIGTTFHYLPLHLSPVGVNKLGGKPGDFPVTESVSGRLLRLPIYPSLTDVEQDYVIDSMKEFLR
ncbi:MAG: dTDP-4-amino-4,6-dideoxygalactose transaminase [Bacteroidota bacterium]